MQDVGHGLWSQDLALVSSVTPPTLRPGVLPFSLNPGTKRREFSLKTDHFPGLKPYIKFPALKNGNKELTH